MSETQLAPLPCPFCGEEPEMQGDGLGGTVIYCANAACPLQVEYDHHTEASEAIAEWNKRAPDARLQQLESHNNSLIAQLARLEAAIAASEWVREAVNNELERMREEAGDE